MRILIFFLFYTSRHELFTSQENDILTEKDSLEFLLQCNEDYE
jgi:hypothetical protein